MFENEEVEESKGRAFAKEIGAIFKYTSAKTSSGIEEIFKSIGNRYIDPNFEDAIPQLNGPIIEDTDIRRGTIKLDKSNKKDTDKKRCCKN